MDDGIEKRIELKAPISRVWRALTDYREFGEWFGVKLDGLALETARLLQLAYPPVLRRLALIPTQPYCRRAADMGNPIFWVAQVSFAAGWSISRPIELSFGHPHQMGMVCEKELRQYAGSPVWNSPRSIRARTAHLS
jgi:hypothetical protein